MSRKKNAFRGFFADLGGMLIVQLLSLALIPFYLRFISLTDYGYWLVISSIIGWIGLADFGIGFAVTRFFIKALNTPGKDETHVNQVANTSLFLFSVISVLFLVAGIALSAFFQQWFHIGDKVFRVFFIAFLVSLINSTITIPFAIFSGILEAKQKIALNRNIQTISLLVQFLSSIGFMLYFKSIVGLAISLLAGTVVSSCILFIYAQKETALRFSRNHISKKLLKELFTFGGYFQVGRTANIIATSTDNLFIASYLDAARVPVYNFTSKLPVLFCNTIASKIPLSMFSGLSQLFDQGNEILFKRSFQKLFAFIVRLAFFAGIMILFVNEKFVDLWVGKNNFGGFYLNLIFVYWVFFETIMRGTGIVIQIYGNLRMWAVSSVIESVINIGLSFYFLHIGWNIAGLALATAIARTFTLGVYWVWFLNDKKLVNYNELLYSFLGNAIKNIPLFLILYLFSRFMNFGNLVADLVVYSIAGILINLSCYDWKIVFAAFQKRSVRFLYTAYLEKY